MLLHGHPQLANCVYDRHPLSVAIVLFFRYHTHFAGSWPGFAADYLCQAGVRARTRLQFVFSFRSMYLTLWPR